MMYNARCSYIIRNNGDKAKLLFTDTGSLTYQNKTKYLYKGFKKDKGKLDFSNCSTNSLFYEDMNKKIK